MKSEYDYGSKKKFVDVLGNVRGKMKHTGDGLENQTAAAQNANPAKTAAADASS